MAKILIKILILLIGITEYAYCQTDHKQIDEEKHILLVASYDMSKAWTDVVIEKTEANTEKIFPHARFNILDFDSVKYANLENAKNLFKEEIPLLKSKRYNAIVAINDKALDLILNNIGEIPEDIPVIFGAYEKDTSKLRAKHAKISGVIGDFEINKTIAVGLSLYPDTKQILILSDSSAEGNYFERKTKATIVGYKNIDVTFLSDNDGNYGKLFEKISSYPKETLLVLGTWKKPAFAKGYRTLDTFTAELAKKLKRPFLICEIPVFNSGALGGYVADPSDMAGEISKILCKVLAGEDASKVPYVKAPLTPVFDYEKIISKKLDYSKLPEDAVYINKPPSFWREHKNAIIIGGVFVLFILAGILAYGRIVKMTMRRSLRLYECMPARVGVFDANENILFLSFPKNEKKQFENVKKLKDIPSVDYQKVSAKLAETFQTGKTTTFDYHNDAVKRAITLTPISKNIFGKAAVLWFSHSNSELQQVRKDALENANKFSQMLHSIGDGVIVTDSGGNITLLNSVAEDILGFTLGEVQSMALEKVLNLVNDNDNSKIESLVKKVLATGETLKLPEETVLVRKDGTKINISDSIAPIFDSKNNIMGTIIVFRNITEELKNRNQISRQMLLANYAGEITYSAYFRLNILTNQIEGSDKLGEIWPVQDGRIISRKDWVHPDDLPKFEKALASIIYGTENITVIDFRAIKGGKIHYYRLKASMENAKNKGGNVFMIGAIQDITDITENARKLSESIELWNSVIENLPIMFFAQKLGGNFEFKLINKEMEKFYAKKREEIIGKTEKELGMPDEIFKKHFIENQNIKDNGISTCTIETLTDAQGNTHRYRATKIPFVSKTGEPLIIGVVSDVSELYNLLECERIINDSIREIAYENSFNKNIDRIFKTIAKQSDCNRITLAQYVGGENLFSIQQAWVDENHKDLKCLSDQDFKILASMVWENIKKHNLTIISNSSENACSALFKKLGTKSAIIAPIFIDDNLWGIIVVAYCDKYRKFSPMDKNLMLATANLVGIAKNREYLDIRLKKADSERQTILDNIKIPIWLYDGKGELTDLNSEVTRLCGVPREKINTQTNRDIFCKGIPEDTPLRQCLRTKKPASATISYNQRDYIVNAEPVLDEQGSILYIIKSAFDVTRINRLAQAESILNKNIELMIKNKDFDCAINSVLKSLCSYLGADICEITFINYQTLSGTLAYSYGNKNAIIEFPVPFADTKLWGGKVCRGNIGIFRHHTARNARASDRLAKTDRQFGDKIAVHCPV